MKKSLRLIISIMMALALIISCSAEPETASGTLKVDVSSSITKGINPQIDLEAANYRLDVTDSSGNVKSLDIGTMTSAEESFPAGSYRVKAYAENRDGIVKGESEEKSFSIYPNRTTSVSLNITEKAGDGSITIGFAGLDVFEEGTTFSVSFREGIGGSLNGEAVKTAALSFNEDGTASASATLKNGFYAIFLESSDDAAGLFLDTVRIVSGDRLSASYSFEFSGDGSVTITNSIAKTPTISVEKSGEELPIVLTSTIDNLDGNASYAWYMDGEALSGANGKDLTITAESGIEAGSHEFMLLVISESGIVWSSEPIAVTVPSAMRSYDLSKMDLDNGFEIEVGADEDIMLTNVNIADGVVAEISELGSSKGVGNNGNGNSGFFTESGDFMFSPDKNMNAYFNGSNHGAKNNLRLKIKKFDSIQDDLSISYSEYKENGKLYNGFYDEYYYVDLSDYDETEKENIVILCNGRVQQAINIIQYGEPVRSGLGLFDFSEDDGFGIYSWGFFNYADVDPSRDPHEVDSSGYKKELTITTAKELENTYEITDLCGVFKTTSRGYHKVTFTVDENSPYTIDILQALARDIGLRYTDGNYAEWTSIPVIDTATNSVTHYLGDINEDMIFTYSINDGIEFESIAVSFESYSEDEAPEIHDISTAFKTPIEIKADGENDFITYAFNSSAAGLVSIVSPEGKYQFPIALNTKNLYQRSTNIDVITETSKGYIVFKCTGALSGELIATISSGKDQLEWIDADYGQAFSEEDNMNKLFYLDGDKNNYVDLARYDNSSLKGVYVSEAPLDAIDGVHEDYGYIAYQPMTSISSSKFDLCNGNGTSNQHYIGTDANSLNGTKSLVLLIKGFEAKNGIITRLCCDVTVEGKEESTRTIYFNRNDNLNHTWREKSSNTVECTECGEERFMISTTMPSSQPEVTVNGLRDNDWCTLQVVNITSFFVGNSSYPFPSLGMFGEELKINLIAPTKDSSIKITKASATDGHTILNVDVFYKGFEE